MTPAAAVQARAVELMGNGTLGLATDATSYPGRTLIAIAVPGAVGVLQVSGPVDQLELARMAGFTLAAPQPSALERAKAKIARAAGRREVAHG